MRKLLNTNQQIQKLSFFMQLAESRKDPDLLMKLGSIIIYEGVVESLAVQAARLLEQIILKAQLNKKEQPTFIPHDEAWFYDKQIYTRIILKEIKRFLPFMDINTGKKFDQEVIDFLKAANDFLDYRNSVIHRLGSPRTNLEDFISCCDKLIDIYKHVIKTNKIMFESLAPYRFSQKELNFFYGNKNEIKNKD
jgi:hypothetical protein